MLISELISHLTSIMNHQGDGTVVIDVEERDVFTGEFYIEDRRYTGNFRGLSVGECEEPYCFIVIPEKIP